MKTMELLTDLSRLMLDDGATRKANAKPNLPVGTLATFTWRGKTWAAYKYDGPEETCFCWVFEYGRDGSFDSDAFLTDPAARCDCYMDRGDQTPGFYQTTCNTRGQWTLCFQEVTP